MARLNFLQSLLVAGHLIVAAVVVYNVWMQHNARETEVSQLRDLAGKELELTTSHREQVAIYEALLEGLREQDPYVVELLARDRLGYRQRNLREVPPPRLDPATND